MISSKLLRYVLARVVKTGTLTVETADRQSTVFGNGGLPKCRLRFTDTSAEWQFLRDPDLHIGELFMDERMVVEDGSIFDVLTCLLAGNQNTAPSAPVEALDKVRYALRRFALLNGLTRARQNVAHHYDLDDRLYDLFLDRDYQYSCAYFPADDTSLEEAQLAKKRHIVAKLLANPGDRVLDIGCGWGGMALYLAAIANAGSVHGITLSEHQIAVARQRAKARGLEDRVSFGLTDYRSMTGTFDRIVSVGMFEHVGLAYYRTFFRKCFDLLSPDGTMLLHTIGLSDGPDAPNPWIAKYIFPGGQLPALSELVSVAERSGLMITDVEVWRLHYAKTLRIWRERFLAKRDEALALYDARFCKMWEFYLAASETAFLYEGVVVYQLQLARDQRAVPLTRSYIEERERTLTVRETALDYLNM